MDSEEMYRRGVEDAKRDQLHPFYYQHYYHYRRGYDRYRRRTRTPGGVTCGVALGLVLAALIAGGAYLWLRAPARSAAPPTARPAAIARVTAAATAAPTNTPIFPTATPPPPPVLRVGGTAQVSNNATGGLRGRTAPSLKGKVALVFQPGERLTILEGPVAADGFVWWRVKGARGEGWSAQQSDNGAVWLEPVE
jgi:hypothetical protein